MLKFIARVELPGWPAADYAKLHRDMRAARYYRIIKGSDGRFWHLPHGEYRAEAETWTARMIEDEVYKIALKSHDTPRVFVTEYTVAVWRGLREVTLDDPAPADT